MSDHREGKPTSYQHVLHHMCQLQEAQVVVMDS